MRPERRRGSSRSLREMYALVAAFQPDWKPYAVSGVLAVLTSVCEALVLVLLTVTAVSVAGGTEPPSFADLEQGQMLALAAVLLVIRLGLVWVNAQVSASLAVRTLTLTRTRMLEAYSSATWESQTRQAPGVLYDLLANRADVVAHAATTLTSVVVAGVNLAVLGATALVLQPLAVLAMGVVGGLMGLALRPLNRRTRELSRQYLHANEVFLNRITDLTRNARDLLVFGTAQRFADRIVEDQREAMVPYRRTRVLTMFTPQAYQSLGLGLALGGLAVASWLGGDRVALLGAVVLLLLRGLSYGQQLLTATQAVNERIPVVGSLVEAHQELVAHRRPDGTARPAHGSPLGVTGVRFAYGTDEVLRGIDLRVAPGEMVGLVGPSGSGKSTLLQIMAGLRRPSAGSVVVGDVPVEDIEPAWRATEVALVSQHGDMITDTVAANIAFLRDIDRSRLEAAAADAQIADEIAELGGFDVVLSREGRNLSGGQLQRLAIARALAGEPSVLLLDEPTSALDVGTERRFQEFLATIRGHTTMVIVAHRLSTVATCDRVLVVEAGAIVADGPPDVVLAEFGREALRRWELSDVGGGPGAAVPEEP